VKIFLIMTLSILCLACSNEPEFDSAQLSSIEAEANELLLSLPSQSFEIDVSRAPSISELSPKSVYITDEGLYIQLNTGFSSENGLFILRNGRSVDTEAGSDPEYKHIDKHVYHYKIEG